MDKPTLLCSRLGDLYVHQLVLNKELRERFRIISVTQQPISHFDPCWPYISAAYEDRAIRDRPDKIKEYYRALIRGWNVKVAILVPKSLWYTELVAEVCQAEGVDHFWADGFFGTALCLDRIGAQFTPDNEIIRYASRSLPGDPKLPTHTRYGQPPTIKAQDLYTRYNLTSDAVCILGQVPHDNSLNQPKGLPYERWLEELITSNPKTRFAFKHHPLTPTPKVATYPNVTVVNESTDALFDAFTKVAAFSSTTIFEAVVKHRKVVTGGYNHLTTSGLVLEAPYDLGNISARLDALTPDPLVRQRWLGFLCNLYAINITGNQVVDRLTKSSDEFFVPHLQVPSPA